MMRTHHKFMRNGVKIEEDQSKGLGMILTN